MVAAITAPAASDIPPGSAPQLPAPDRTTAARQGRVRATEIRSPRTAGSTVLACEVADSTGKLTALFYGRTQIAGVEPGSRIRLHGTVTAGPDGHPAMISPAYELLA